MSDIDFGPQKDAVQAILDKYDTLTLDEKHQMRDLRDDAFWTGWNVAGDGRAVRAGLGAARGALCVRLCGGWDGYGHAACGAALAVLLRHTFTPEEWPHYEALTGPWVTVTGMPAHPDDVAAAQGAEEEPDELDALSVIVTVLSPLDEATRRRVMHYLDDRFLKVGA